MKVVSARGSGHQEYGSAAGSEYGPCHSLGTSQVQCVLINFSTFVPGSSVYSCFHLGTTPIIVHPAYSQVVYLDRQRQHSNLGSR